MIAIINVQKMIIIDAGNINHNSNMEWKNVKVIVNDIVYIKKNKNYSNKIFNDTNE